MSEPKENLANVVSMDCVGPTNHSLWTHPRDRSESDTKLFDRTGLDRLPEAGPFDVFFVGYHDVYQGSIDLTAPETIRLPVNDPTPLVPLMAAATRNLSFGVRFSTLDHPTDGPTGWNIVTGFLDCEARAVRQSTLEVS